MADLVLNGGSSSWKSALFAAVPADAVPASAEVLEPLASVTLSWRSEHEPAMLEGSARSGRGVSREVAVVRGGPAVPVLLEAYRELGCDTASIATVGHRIVHGGASFAHSVVIDEAVTATLRALAPFAPRHNSIEIAGIEAVAQALPGVRQVAAFDTAFHRTLPAHASTYGGPAEWLARDIRRYGFHGINVAYCVERAGRMLNREVADLHCVVAHLGGGCSVSAVLQGRSIDTTMGFTPLDGVVMGTRSGSVDPGILLYLLRDAPTESAGDAAARLDNLLNSASGLLGLSGVSSDIRLVEEAASAGDERAESALAVFAYRVATAIAGMLPALQHIDALIFTGGIGLHAASMRERICACLAFAGISLQPLADEAGSSDLDLARPAAATRVLRLNAREEWFIARECSRVA